MENLERSGARFSGFELRGRDAVDFGHRLFSRDIKNMPMNEGALSLFLTPEGRVSAEFWVLKTKEGLELYCLQTSSNQLLSLIDRYHFSEAFEVLKIESLKMSFKETSLKGEGLLRWESDRFKGIWRGIEWSFLKTSPEEVDPDWNRIRIQHLIPEYLTDYNEKTLVFDLGFDELCDPKKGCYIGQEIVERVRSRGGAPTRSLCLFEWSSEVPSFSIVSLEDKPIGSTTSSLISKNIIQGLGFIKKATAKVGDPILSGGVPGFIKAIYEAVPRG